MTQMKVIQSTVVIETGYKSLSRQNSCHTNCSAYIMRRGMNIPMIRMICGDEEGIRVPELHTYALPCLGYSVCMLCMNLARFCHKTIMGTTSGMGWVRDRPADHPPAPPSSSNSTQSTPSSSFILGYNALHNRHDVEIGGW